MLFWVKTKNKNRLNQDALAILNTMHLQRLFLREKNRIRRKQISTHCFCCLKKTDSAKTIAVMHILASVISNRFRISKKDWKITCQQTKGERVNADSEQVSFPCSCSFKKNICEALIREFSIFHVLLMTTLKLITSFKDLCKENKLENPYSKWQTCHGCGLDWEPLSVRTWYLGNTVSGLVNLDLLCF